MNEKQSEIEQLTKPKKDYKTDKYKPKTQPIDIVRQGDDRKTLNYSREYEKYEKK